MPEEKWGFGPHTDRNWVGIRQCYTHWNWNRGIVYLLGLFFKSLLNLQEVPLPIGLIAPFCWRNSYFGDHSVLWRMEKRFQTAGFSLAAARLFWSMCLGWGHHSLASDRFSSCTDLLRVSILLILLVFCLSLAILRPSVVHLTPQFFRRTRVPSWFVHSGELEEEHPKGKCGQTRASVTQNRPPSAIPHCCSIPWYVERDSAHD